MILEVLVLRLARRLAGAGVPFAVSGSLASSLYGQPRAATDADLVLAASPEQLERFLPLLSEEFWVEAEAARAALRRRGAFAVVDWFTGYKADLFFRPESAWGGEVLRRRRMLAWGVEAVPFVSAEDAILSKLVWSRVEGSERHLHDVLGVLGVQGPELDLGYLRRWAAELGAGAYLEELLRLAVLPAGERE